ncbi:hydroxyacid dehydrogenase [Paracoccus sp. 1_MG-2023]|uniref:hydroxyacid dehydrogenase n=1 Tax=unclassified Paracoccus (in: a-proteobacteria) TaxID=2688777 RepID=UPI001C09CDBF|nr:MULTISPECIES: hydroxyacid dehydrogenase [unclassified Paracoccus (in: a-proteobacteria)]MBU2957846.1 hydroxyacid dehydrogenase [Paracoccus sp. C2R09]MDO6667306.1 hydroxyacid dehydrogenase [Paracoccus sp. 1_MG-2023]
MTDDSALPNVAILMPRIMRDRVMPPPVMTALSDFARPVILSDAELTGDLAPVLRDMPAVITGWRSPVIPASAWSPRGGLRFVSHSAGSVRRLGIDHALQSGVLRVSHAAPVIARAVAEFTLTQILAHLRRHRVMDAGMRDGTGWDALRDGNTGGLLGARQVGILGLGYVGRLVLDLLRPFGCRIAVHDPFLDAGQARELGVVPMGLEALFRDCDVVTLHAADLPATRGMITADHLAAMPQGALLVNTARAGLIRPGAMAAELRRGRIFAALDTFDAEPLPQEDELRMLPNAYLSPHCAGHTTDTYRMQGMSAVEEVRRFLNGEPLLQEIRRERAAQLA